MIDKKTEKPWFLYIIKMANNNLYTGVTIDISRRFAEHQGSKKGAKALKGKGPLELMFCIQLESKSDALKAEYWIKRQSKKQKLAIIAGKLMLDYKHHRLSV